MQSLNIIVGILIVTIIIMLFVIMYRNINNRLDRREMREMRRYGCRSSRWGCCPDGITVRSDNDGTNCVNKIIDKKK